MRSVNPRVGEGDRVGGLFDSAGGVLKLGEGESATGPGGVHEAASTRPIRTRGIRRSLGLVDGHDAWPTGQKTARDDREFNVSDLMRSRTYEQTLN